MQKLLHAYNLVAALREFYAEVNLEVIRQGLGITTTNEQALLSITESEGWIREVNILGNGKPAIYAKVVAPIATYHNYKNELNNLGNQFLGESFLYKIPHQRSTFVYIRKKSNEVDSRYSIFNVANGTFLVTEYFLCIN